MLSFEMSKEQKMVKDSFAEVVRDLVTPEAHDMDEAGEIPKEHLQTTWELGASVSAVPEEFGGDGMESSPILNALILEELASGDMAFAIAATLPSVFITPVLEMGTDAQKKKYLPLYCGETYKPATMAICEPHFGADAVDLKTTAQKKNGVYVLNGTKCFVPKAKDAGHMLVAARVDDKNELFIVENSNPGLKVSEREKTMGLYSLDTYEVTLTDCEVPAEDLLGGDQGCDYAMVLQKTRIGLSALATGVSRASFIFARDYSKDRVQFGEPIAHRQSVAFMIAEMAYETDAMRLMTWKAASSLVAGNDAKREAYLGKLYSGEMSMKVCDYGVQILGGHGYIRDYPQERGYRNARGIATLEGLVIV